MRSHLSGQQLCMVVVLNYLADIVKHSHAVAH